MPGAADGWDLAITKRCLTKDLGLSEQDLERGIDDLADSNAVIKAFRDMRSQHPDGTDHIRGLQANISAFSLHAGAERALTWYDQELDVVWLLASRFHRSGQRDDSYPFFRGLSKEHLLPTKKDITRLSDSRSRDFAEALMEDVPSLLDRARSAPN